MLVTGRVWRGSAFGGWHKRYRNRAAVLDAHMNFAIFLPPQAERGPVPQFYWLSGLT